MVTKIIYLITLCGTALFTGTVFSQSPQYQLTKPGVIVVDNQLSTCPGVDVTTITRNLTFVVDWLRENNPAMNSPAGFDASISISGNLCEEVRRNEAYGIQTNIYLSFRHFYIENGVSKTATDWSAHGTEIIMNNPVRFISTQFDETGFQTGDPAHLKQPLEKALANLKRYFITVPVIKEIAPGVRLYAPEPGTWFTGTIIVSDSDRADIWIPVTVKEIMEAKLAYYKVKQEIDSINYEKNMAMWAKMNFKPDPGQSMRPMIYDVIKKEYEAFTAAELSLPAYSSSGEESGISMINARGDGRAVVRFNTECWDRSLPATAIQYMSMQYRTATPAELAEFKERNDGLSDFAGMFYNSLPVQELGKMIKK